MSVIVFVINFANDPFYVPEVYLGSIVYYEDADLSIQTN
jgi:hypothetical protein